MNIYRLMYNPRPAKNIQEKKAFIVGGGIARLAAAVFLIDDAKMPGQNITIIDKRAHFGGCCDGYFNGEGFRMTSCSKMPSNAIKHCLTNPLSLRQRI